MITRAIPFLKMPAPAYCGVITIFPSYPRTPTDLLLYGSQPLIELVHVVELRVDDDLARLVNHAPLALLLEDGHALVEVLASLNCGLIIIFPVLSM